MNWRCDLLWINPKPCKRHISSDLSSRDKCKNRFVRLFLCQVLDPFHGLETQRVWESDDNANCCDIARVTIEDMAHLHQNVLFHLKLTMELYMVSMVIGTLTICKLLRLFAAIYCADMHASVFAFKLGCCAWKEFMHTMWGCTLGEDIQWK